jgi:hypothetical protein
MFRTDIWLFRSLNALPSIVAHESLEKSSAELSSIASSLCVAYFDSTSPRFRRGMLPLILKQVLPLTSHQKVNLRIHAESFLTRQYALIFAFCPRSLLSAYSALDTTQLQPAAQASIFIFWTNCLRCVAPRSRAEEVGTCLSILLSSDLQLLSKVTVEIWTLLRDSLTERLLKTLIEDILVRSSLAVPTAILCGRDPQALLPIVFRTYSLQFIKEFLPSWPTSSRLEPRWVSGRILEAIGGTNSSEISTALEIVYLWLSRSNRPPLDAEEWTSIFRAIEALWTRPTTNFSHRAKTLEVLGAAASCKGLKVEELHRFLFFEGDTPSVIVIALVKLAAVFIKGTRTIPHGLLDFLTRSALERDPTLYLATINCLEACFHEMHEIAPERTERVLDLCLNPLPRDCVEQVAILRMFIAFDWTRFSVSRLRTNMIDIILKFIYDPKPSIIPEIIRLFATVNCVLPYTQLDWFEHASAYLQLLPQVSPFFIIELLDGNLLTPSSIPAAIDSIAHSVAVLPLHTRQGVFGRATTLIIACFTELHLDFEGRTSLNKYKTPLWDHYTAKLPALLDCVADDFATSTFGEVMKSSLGLIVSTMADIILTTNSFIGLVSIATLLACSFTSAACTVIRMVFRREKNPKMKPLIDKFFRSAFPFEHATDVSRTALDCLERNELDVVDEYLMHASGTSREILSRYRFPDGIYFPTYLAVRDWPERADYVRRCVEVLPFKLWVIEESDFEFIGSLNGVKVPCLNQLDDIHARVVELYPTVFVIGEQVEEATGGEFHYSICEETTLGFTISAELDRDPVKQEYVAGEVPVPFSPYPFRPPSRAELFMFLWYSQGQVLDDERWGLLEQYALSIDDLRFHLAFLGYGLRHSLRIDVELWAQNLKVDRNNRTTYLSFSCFCYYVNRPWGR